MESKESGSRCGPSLGDLPPKVLLMIFRRVPFADRLRMSAVCRRWNQLIFEHFGDRIMLHLQDGTYKRGLARGDPCGDRKYANVRMVGRSVRGLLSVQERWIDAVGEHVQELHLGVACLDVDLLPGLLQKFTNLQKLVLFVLKFQRDRSVRRLKEGTLPNIRLVECKGLIPSLQTLGMDLIGNKSKTGLTTFLKIFRQRNLPAVRHITMTCIGGDCDFRRNPTWLAWLNEFAPVLHTLQIDFANSFMLSKFFALNFSNLKSLTLTMFTLSPILFPSLHLSEFCPYCCWNPQLKHFEQFLSRLVCLNSLKIALKDVHYGEVADAIYSMDHLQELKVQLACVPNYANPLQLEDIWYMKNLRKLEIHSDHIEFPPEHIIKPMPLVEDLTLGKVKRVDFCTLRTIFPRVKILDVCKCPNVQLLVLTLAWPSLENLSLQLDQPDFDLQLPHLILLQKLKVLRVFSEKGLLMDSLNIVLGIDTLEQLYIDGIWKGTISSNLNRSCRLYLNGASFVGGARFE